MKTSTTFLSIGMLLCLWSSCGRETVDYPLEEQQLSTALPLTDICFVDAQQGFASAGTIFSRGVVFQTDNGGQTWSLLDSFSQGIHSLSFDGQHLWMGESGQLLHKQALPLTTSVREQRIVQSGWWPWHSQLPLPNGDILLVGGENFGRGFVHRYRASNNTFVLSDTFSHELREVIRTPNGTLHAVGYGLVMRSTDEGATWDFSPVQGDFFRGVDFPSDDVGYVVGEYGSVYKTTDGGKSWRNCRAGNSLFANPKKLLRDLAFVDETTGFLVGTGSVVFRTTDGGKTWKKVANLDDKTEYQKIEIQGDVAYLLGHYGQLFRLEL